MSEDFYRAIFTQVRQSLDESIAVLDRMQQVMADQAESSTGHRDARSSGPQPSKPVDWRHAKRH